MKDHELMPFGKHEGLTMGEVPASYLLWAYGVADLMRRYPGVKEYIEKNKKHLEADVKRGDW